MTEKWEYNSFLLIARKGLILFNVNIYGPHQCYHAMQWSHMHDPAASVGDWLKANETTSAPPYWPMRFGKDFILCKFTTHYAVLMLPSVMTIE